MTYEEATISLGIVYIKQLQRDREEFIGMMKRSDSIRSAADFFYCYVAVEQKIIPLITSIAVSEKNKYWVLIKDEDLDQGKKLKFCRGLYALDTMIPLLNL